MDRYYKVSIDSKTGSKLKKILCRYDVFYKQVEKLRQKYGFKSIWHSGFYYADVSAVEFEKEPDMTIWKKIKDCYRGYYPRSKRGNKEILKDFEELGKLRIRRDELDHVIGNTSVFCNAGFHFTTPGCYLFVVESEWECNIPSDCEEISNIEYNNLITKE